MIVMIAKGMAYASAICIYAGMAFSFYRQRVRPGPQLLRQEHWITRMMVLHALTFWAALHYGALPWSPPTRCLGSALVLAGAIFNIWGRWELGSMWSHQAALFESHRLKTAGAYAVVRHPLYASQVWMYLGATLVFQEITGLLVTLGLFLPLLAYRCRQEEALLHQAFPDYRKYCGRTGRLFPLLWPPSLLGLRGVQ
jgi:protein-S-isoprenylcysteine O-methyltransferase Ste14